MEQYGVTGMSCAACSARVEKAVMGVPGVTSCSVSLLTNSMGVEGDGDPGEIVEAVKKAGYGAYLKKQKEAEAAETSADETLTDRETPVLKKRLLASLVFLLPLMYISMGHTMWNWPLPGILEQNPAGAGLIQLLLAGIVMVINQKFFISGWMSLLHRSPNMDTLVSLGSGASFFYSVCMLVLLTDVQRQGEMKAAMDLMHSFYFESAAMILTLITVGKMLEARSKGKTTDALKNLMKLTPRTATVIRHGQELRIEVGQVRKGDVFVVRPGEQIPVDGIVLEGDSAVNEAALTGESIPADKAPGDPVSAATVNQSGFLRCQATRVGEDTTLSQIIQLVSDAAATKAPIAKVADKVSGIFVPVVMTIAAVTFLVWMFAGQSVGFALARGISVLVISCPCALGLATPVAIMVGNGRGARSGILFKTAESLEETGKIRIVALDKTGTITSGEPEVTDVLPAEGVSSRKLITLACVLEQKSEHPLAKAVLKYGKNAGWKAEEDAEAFQAVPGNGLRAKYRGSQLEGGNLRFIRERAVIPEWLEETSDRLAGEGKTPLLFTENGNFLGIIAVADVLKEDSCQAIRELHQMGIQVVMVTGDHQRTAEAIADSAGVDGVYAGILPEGKENVIRELMKKGRTAMVGDGINDAPALTRADMGIAIGAGTDVAIDAADVVLMKSRLRDVPAAIRLSRAVLRNIHENLFWAFIYNIIGIPLAAGVWYPVFGWELNPMFGAAAMSLSSVCVVTNALRLNVFRLYDARRDHRGKTGNSLKTMSEHTDRNKKENRNDQEEIKLKKIMQIQGMMCGHCQARVKKTLEALEQVAEAEVSYEKGTAVVTLHGAVSDEILKDAVEAQDYQVTGIQEVPEK